MIPRNLEECFVVLKQNLNSKDLAFIKESCDNVVTLHSSLGRKIRNDWGLWGEAGSELKTHFQQLGLFHPDDMSSLILNSFHHNLNNLPLEIEEQIQAHIAYWDGVNEEMIIINENEKAFRKAKKK